LSDRPLITTSTVTHSNDITPRKILDLDVNKGNSTISKETNKVNKADLIIKEDVQINKKKSLENLNQEDKMNVLKNNVGDLNIALNNMAIQNQTGALSKKETSKFPSLVKKNPAIPSTDAKQKLKKRKELIKQKAKGKHLQLSEDSNSNKHNIIKNEDPTQNTNLKAITAEQQNIVIEERELLKVEEITKTQRERKEQKENNIFQDASNKVEEEKIYNEKMIIERIQYEANNNTQQFSLETNIIENGKQFVPIAKLINGEDNIIFGKENLKYLLCPLTLDRPKRHVKKPSKACNTPIQFITSEESNHIITASQTLDFTPKKSLCGNCSLFITGKHLSACGKSYHEDCFVCTKCKISLKDDFYDVNQEVFCENCFEKMQVVCDKCQTMIEDECTELPNGQVLCKNCFLCFGCKKTLFDEHFIFEDNLYCEKCMKKCDGCEEPLSKKYATINSTQTKYCEKCFVCCECNQLLDQNLKNFGKKLYCGNCFSTK
jgi:hypothetical protein